MTYINVYLYKLADGTSIDDNIDIRKTFWYSSRFDLHIIYADQITNLTDKITECVSAPYVAYLLCAPGQIDLRSLWTVRVSHLIANANTTQKRPLLVRAKISAHIFYLASHLYCARYLKTDTNVRGVRKGEIINTSI